MALWMHAGRAAAALAAVAVAALGPEGARGYARDHVLRASLASVLFYIAQGIATALLGAAGRRSGRLPDTLHVLRTASGAVLFGELPALLAVAYAGLRTLPASCVRPYARAVLVLEPVAVLAEGWAALTLILSAGQLWGPLLADAHAAVQGAALALCGALVAWCVVVLARLHAAGLLAGAAVSAGLASSCALLATCVACTLLVPHGSVVDASLLVVYVTYNIWAAASASSPDGFLPEMWARLSALLSAAQKGSSAGQAFAALAGAFSPHLLATMLVQMAVFVTTLRIMRVAHKTRPGVRTALVLHAWPALGRAFVVAYYTQAWLRRHGCAALAPALCAWTAPRAWRWANVYVAIALYARHLVVPPACSHCGAAHCACPDDSSEERPLAAQSPKRSRSRFPQ